LLFIYSS